MLRNYFKIALRSLWRHKLYSSINIIGLAVGLAACLLMSLYVRHELTYDSFHTKADRIVRITSFLKTPDAPMSLANSPALLAPFLNLNYPEVEKAVRFQSVAATIQHETKLFNEPDVYYAEQAVFDVFSYQFVAGSSQQALTQPNTAVLTEPLAKKYFGDKDAVGQTLQINKTPYQITGIMADLPSNADLKIKALLYSDFSKSKSWMDDLSVYTFALFRQPTNESTFEKKLKVISERHIQPELKKIDAEGYSLAFQVEPLADVHYSQGKLEDTPKGNKQYGYLFSFLAAFVLVIALLNYISLLTARATERAKEVGIRKANGAFRVLN
jgi:putative ABC transport system permease protein